MNVQEDAARLGPVRPIAKIIQKGRARWTGADVMASGFGRRVPQGCVAIHQMHNRSVNHAGAFAISRR